MTFVRMFGKNENYIHSIKYKQMSLRNQLVESFIKGIGKASAAIVVMGVIGGAWYVLSPRFKFHNSELNMEQVDFNLKDKQMFLSEDDDDVNKYKQILEGL